MVVKHSYWVSLTAGLLFLGGVLMGFIGGGALPPQTPVPYTFDIDDSETGQREDGYHLAGIVNKIEDCRRLEQPAGFVVEVTGSVTGDTYSAEWRSVLGRDRDESRPIGSDPLHIVIDLPPVYSGVEVWTAHACPDPETHEGEPVVYVRTLLHEIPGNIVSQRAEPSAP